jgi:hypothetical protein
MPDFEFFVSTGTPKPAVRAMRSHAIRTALQSRKAAEGSLGRSADPGSVNSRRRKDLQKDLMGRFRLGTLNALPGDEEGSEVHIMVAPTSGINADENRIKNFLDPQPRESEVVVTRIQQLGTSTLDPFDTLPVPTNPRVSMLVKYCGLILC